MAAGQHSWLGRPGNPFSWSAVFVLVINTAVLCRLPRALSWFPLVFACALWLGSGKRRGRLHQRVRQCLEYTCSHTSPPDMHAMAAVLAKWQMLHCVPSGFSFR